MAGSRTFNGTSDIITLATSASIDSMITAAEFTLIAWVYVTDTNPGNSDMIWNFGGNGPGVTFYLNCGPTNGQLNGFVQTGNFDMNCNSTVVSGLAANQWVNVAMTYKDTSVGGDSIAHLYFGGVEVTYAHEVPGTGGLSLTTGQSAFIGTDNNGDFLLGNISEARTYNLSLSAGQIAAIAADTTGDPNAGGAQANLVAYLHLCGTASPEPDTSGNANVGILTGTGTGSASPGYSGCVAPPSYYSQPDCRNYAAFPNSSRNLYNTLIYDVQTSSNSAVPGVDSRAAGAPVDSRANKPTNSRTPGTYGPGE